MQTQELSREKFYNAINSFLMETLPPEKAANQTEVYVDNMFEVIDDIDQSIQDNNPDMLPSKFHRLKNILLYGDFYYESDLCADIEQQLKKDKNVDGTKSMYEELLDTLKSDT